MAIARLSTSFRSSLQLALAAGVTVASVGVAVAADPIATQAELDVEVFSQQGATMGCGLSFLVGWVNQEHQVFAAAGTLNFFAPDAPSIGSLLKVRTTLNNQPRDLSFAWIDVQNIGSTKAFSPLPSNQSRPFFLYSDKPDRQGLARLNAAARTGFTLGLSIVGLPLDETVQIPAVPRNVMARLDECIRAVATRQSALERK